MMEWIRGHRALAAALAMTLAFASLMVWQLFFEEEYWMVLFPAGLALLWFFLARFESVLVFIAFFTPLSLNLDVTYKLTLSVPTEPLMILFTIFFFFRVLVARNYDIRLLRHPVTIMVTISLLWMATTSLVSEMPVASLKHTAARLWFVIPFFYACVQFMKDPKLARKLLGAYSISLAAVIVIATLKTIGNYSDLQTVHRVMQPFYNDHTAYGCVIALFIPLTIYFISEGSRKAKWRMESSKWTIGLWVAMLVLLCIGVVFSYCRAAWLSLAGALLMYLLVRAGIKMRWVVAGIAVAAIAFFSYQGDLLYKMGKNKQDSSFTLAEQVQSISNISTDASNLERLNRWACAVRMWNEHKLTGCGPGTYQFLYASYQRSYQLSTISTNAGDLGNAHSEYIGPLTEQGVPGAVIVLLLFGTTFATGVRVYRTAKDPRVRRMALAFALSLLTYYIHGIFNNFLDSDKLSVPFWILTAAIVALDVYGDDYSSEVSEMKRR